MKKYELRLYDDVLAVFSAERDPAGNIAVRIEWEDESKSHLLPPIILADRTVSGYAQWLQSRVIPKHRAFVGKILAQAGLAIGDTLGIIDVCKGLSVNDSFWTPPEGFAGSWEQYNLFENKLDEALALVAYTGYTDSQRRENGLSTEWSSGGAYPKAWRRIGDDLVLYKAGSPLNEGTANPDYGPYSEFFASQVADAIGLAHVAYSVDVWNEKLASTCRLMNTADISLVPLYQAAGASGFSGLAAAGLMLGDEALNAITDTLIFDALIANTDRHAGNIAVFRDNATGDFLSFAPLYDHNRALFPTDMESDFDSWPGMAAFLSPHGTNLSFDEVVGRLITRRHHEWARTLLSFEFANDETRPLSPKRVEAMQKFVRTRARTLLETPPNDDGAVRRALEAIVGDGAPDRNKVPVLINGGLANLKPVRASRDFDAHLKEIGAAREALEAATAAPAAVQSRRKTHLD